MTNPVYQIEIINKEDCERKGFEDSRDFEGLGGREGSTQSPEISPSPNLSNPLLPNKASRGKEGASPSWALVAQFSLHYMAF
jgi:hypothetical protein